MKKLVFVFLVLVNFACTKWFEVQPQITITLQDCEGKIMPNQYVEYEDGEGTIRATTDKHGKLKINDFSGNKIFISVPAKNFNRTETVNTTITITVC